jgi:AraC family transcriptional regulator, regulatory protein of adaptative response / DNA-3-methyladenine glycosylase II
MAFTFARSPTSDEVKIRYEPPFAADLLLSFFAARAVPGVERVADGTYARSFRASNGPASVFELTPEAGEPIVSVRVPGGADDQALGRVVASARRLFDLDAEAGAIDAALSADPVLRPLIERAPGVRVPGAADGFEMVVRAIVGQQVSVAGARTTLGRIVSRIGERIGSAVGSVTHLFPTPERLAEAGVEELGLPAARAEAIRMLSGMVIDGELDLSGASDPETALKALVTIRGVGPWTAAYVAMRALHDTDAFPATDLGIRHGFAEMGLADDAASIIDHAERWRPWRAYAAMHLWQARQVRGLDPASSRGVAAGG